MNVVYLIYFPDRIKDGVMPNKYIGSKSNCYVKNGKIFGKRGEYTGSSRSKSYKNAILNERYLIEILGEYPTYNDCLNAEKQFHIQYDVVSNPEYWNKSIATESTYSNPEYGTFKHVVTGEYVRLKLDDKRVLNGEYVGTTKGSTLWNNGVEHTLSDECPGEGWVKGMLDSWHCPSRLGMTFTEEQRERMSDSVKQFHINNPERSKELRKEASERCTKTFKGKKQSKEHVEKRRKFVVGKLVLKNVETGECIQISVEDRENYDPEIWKLPVMLKPARKGWMVYNNGVVNKTFEPGDEIPEGWVRGTLWFNEKKVKNGKWYNNGEKATIVYDGQPVPEGWVRGMGTFKRKRDKDENSEN